ncbi:acyl-CoA dehydratase activase [Paludicola sp. MB14-C6]|uniref:acyl-CoA dehydratase activase-related protein n=1 Tax=Paludihabitans sp. MB14-C6 TaxID=3070656 RepID=UPI0027DC294D|nr:acyl-CoA dehydratase activase-related protein [Paludicola sp. MB14-C6]WMJ23088.1 acyl-CoA dehydratase activase [Paludicola sp. MB14-C6]
MNYKLGIDVGSTTLKLVLLDEHNNVCYKSYERHLSKVWDLTIAKLRELEPLLADEKIKVAFTGSAGLGISSVLDIDFVQEVFAASTLIKGSYSDVDVAIELGGEDAKIIFLGETIEERMNSTCAGGTGSFIDQMATLLNVKTQELDELSLQADSVYPIASRCGVFAKTDIQPLINQGASKANVAASIYKAVVDQTITGLAQGREIKGKVLFLGGPLSFLKGLQHAFIKTLHLSEECAIFPEYAEYFVAYGSAVYAGGLQKTYSYQELLHKLIVSSQGESNYIGLAPLFQTAQDYESFVLRHNKKSVHRINPKAYTGKAYLGIDAGSTTTKMVLIDEENNLLYEYYQQNKGNPLDVAKTQLSYIYNEYPNIQIAQAAVTGYGEELMKNAFSLDHGIVETVAHFMAAKYFNPNVDFIIDIGGQDMKCFGIKDGMVDSIMLNEACSSGCGSFIETFAHSLGYEIEDFAQLALQSKKPVDLGTRCTVFMNSSVKQAQKNGASVADISAGLAISVVKNAIYKVLRVSDAKSLGRNIVVQGGTFLNNGVLRAFESIMETEVTRPDIAGLMGAFGAALYAKQKAAEKSTILSKDDLYHFSHTSSLVRCGLCQNKCSLTINQFSNGRKLISGNRCERPLKQTQSEKLPNLYEIKREYINQFQTSKGSRKTIGLPKVLNFYDTMPFWFTFFRALDFSVTVSGNSSRSLYQKGQHTISSDTICYGAKLVHGHIINLVEKGVDAIFYPCMTFNFNEGISDNCFHCPVVAYYPEVIASNIKVLNQTKFMYPYLSLNDIPYFEKQIYKELLELDSSLTLKEVKKACKQALSAQSAYRDTILQEGKKALAYAEQNNKKVIVLAGRPYHIDSEINHGIDSLISTLGFVVLSEDALPFDLIKHPRRVLNQWTYHARMYQAADYVCNQKNTELVQLVSFGCGLDAVTTDEVRDILRRNGKLYTQLKIDEISNLGAVKIRMRSLLAAMNERESSINAGK